VGHMISLEGCGKSRPYLDSITGLYSLYLVAISPELSRPLFSDSDKIVKNVLRKHKPYAGNLKS
jgi:hypothetical protein